ncbi:protein of unknown function (plasmid) [Cupriavidus taiwanensis]|uniref:Uncharacterized protein n=1 Tax=Cupriavidus taiwanensis TaxID=164546 RepID=A0A375ISL6_9BURK|nr:protein of unknown function [Cupriavidus taiwanensis]
MNAVANGRNMVVNSMVSACGKEGARRRRKTPVIPGSAKQEVRMHQVVPVTPIRTRKNAGSRRLSRLRFPRIVTPKVIYFAFRKK